MTSPLKPAPILPTLNATEPRHLVYVPVSELAGYRVGDILGFTVQANDKGAFAQQVEQVEDEAA
ncbi:hypothetical protein I0C86_03180 [Plantactinospora sp. S1510]|uniref:Uncharacterized protein n=1 Tax=Plantactinospora alkalitolerans TaxID=2789879 RepID=A0ABS0GP84_9ACTN|nr:hypothetical protein [Plantactinospora alkalitolerans]MBF9128001.1 hypothetical protein [Plantactinospora alkalitolerans]